MKAKSKLKALKAIAASKFNESAHPRYPKGHPMGGQFMDKGNNKKDSYDRLLSSTRAKLENGELDFVGDKALKALLNAESSASKREILLKISTALDDIAGYNPNLVEVMKKYGGINEKKQKEISSAREAQVVVAAIAAKHISKQLSLEIESDTLTDDSTIKEKIAREFNTFEIKPLEGVTDSTPSIKIVENLRQKYKLNPKKNELLDRFCTPEHFATFAPLVAAGVSFISPEDRKVLDDNNSLISDPFAKQRADYYRDKEDESYWRNEYESAKAGRRDKDDPLSEADLFAHHKKAFDRLKKSADAYQTVTKEQEQKSLAVMAGLKETLINNSSLSATEAQKMAESIPIGSGFTDVEDVASLRGVVANFYELMGGKGITQAKSFRKTNLRANVNDEGQVTIGSYVDTKTIFHELGHCAEKEDREIFNAALNWVRTRATGFPEGLDSLSGGYTGYSESEEAWVDNFVSPYVGKVYANDTEAISMGIEAFADPKSMLKFYQKDPEHFFLTVGVINKKRRIN